MKRKHVGMLHVSVPSALAAAKLRGYVEAYGKPEQLVLIDRMVKKADQSGSRKLWLPVPDEVAKAQLDAYFTEFSDTTDPSMLPIEELDLSVRAYNCLKKNLIDTVGEVLARTEDDLLDIRNFGDRSLDEVKVKLASMGLALKTS
jgi:DNA-directed RNA polymerase alpha subunit